MLANYHTHTTFCDGKSSAEDVVLSAIDKGFCAIGFSGHAYTPFDLSYCMKDRDLYFATINQLKEKYGKKIQIYLGTEEDAYAPVNRSDYDYIIGSSHYVCVNEVYYAVDSGYDSFKKSLDAFNGDTLKFAEEYYKSFCEYLIRRKPDIVGHFDLVTKYEEQDTQLFLSDEKYWEIAKKYIAEAVKCDSLFEINTGAMAKGLRTAQYPHERLLHVLKKNNGKIILSSDSHIADTIDYKFSEMRAMLRDIGFEYVYVLYDNTFKKDYIK